MGNIVATTTPSGNVVRTVFTREGFEAELSDDVGALVRFLWDEESRMVERTVAGYNPELYEYDALNRVIGVVQPNSGRVSFVRDRGGEVIRFQDALGRTWRFEYNEFGELTQLTTPAGNRTLYRYDSAARLSEIVDPLGNVFVREYGPTGEITQQRFFDGRVVSYFYDSLGRLERIAHPDGTETRLARDGLGLVLRISGSLGEPTVFEHDELCRVVSTRRGAVVVTYEYDEEGRVVREDQDGVRVLRSYDRAGRCVALEIEGFGRRTFEYDKRNRPTAMCDFDGTRYELAFDLGNKLREFRSPDGRTLTWIYGREGRLRSAQLTGRNQVATLSLDYDLAGQETSRAAGGRITFAYDRDGRLVRRVVNGDAARFEFAADDSLMTTSSGAPVEASPGGVARSSASVRLRMDACMRVVYREDQRGAVQFRYDTDSLLRRIERADGLWAEYRLRRVRPAVDDANERRRDSLRVGSRPDRREDAGRWRHASHDVQE